MGRKTDLLWGRVGGSGETGRSRSGWGDLETTEGDGSEGLSLPPPGLWLLFPPGTDVTVVHPDAVPVIFAVTFHGVVGEVALCYFKIGVDDHL